MATRSSRAGRAEGAAASGVADPYAQSDAEENVTRHAVCEPRQRFRRMGRRKTRAENTIRHKTSFEKTNPIA